MLANHRERFSAAYIVAFTRIHVTTWHLHITSMNAGVIHNSVGTGTTVRYQIESKDDYEQGSKHTLVVLD